MSNGPGAAGFFGGVLSGIAGGMVRKQERRDKIELAKTEAALKMLAGEMSNPRLRPDAYQDYEQAYMDLLSGMGKGKGKGKGGGDSFATLQEKLKEWRNKVYSTGEGWPGMQAELPTAPQLNLPVNIPHPETGQQMDAGTQTVRQTLPSTQLNIPGRSDVRGPYYSDQELQGMEEKRLDQASQRKINEAREAAKARAEFRPASTSRSATTRNRTLDPKDPALIKWASENNVQLLPDGVYTADTDPTTGKVVNAYLYPQSRQLSQAIRNKIQGYVAAGMPFEQAKAKTLADFMQTTQDADTIRAINAILGMQELEQYGTPLPDRLTSPGGIKQDIGTSRQPQNQAQNKFGAPNFREQELAQIQQTQAQVQAQGSKGKWPPANNNPGNIKINGQIAKLNSLEEGWRLLYGDLRAKMTGHSQHIVPSTGKPLNGASTIAQLGEVYAPYPENQKGVWAKNVAAALRTDVNTPIGRFADDKGIQQFAQAVAVAEHGAPMNLSGVSLPSSTFGSIRPLTKQESSDMQFFISDILSVKASSSPLGTNIGRRASRLQWERGKRLFYEVYGISPEELSTALQQRKYDSQSLGFLQNRLHAIGQLQLTLNYHGKVWEDLTKKGDSAWAVYDRIKQWFENKTQLDPDTAQVLIAAAAVQREYGRLISNAPLSRAMPPVSRMDEATKILPTWNDFATVQASVKQLAVEAERERQAHVDYNVGLVMGMSQPLNEYIRRIQSTNTQYKFDPVTGRIMEMR